MNSNRLAHYEAEIVTKYRQSKNPIFVDFNLTKTEQILLEKIKITIKSPVKYCIIISLNYK